MTDQRDPLEILYVDTEEVWRGGQDQLFGLMDGMHRRGHRVVLAAPAGAPLTEKARSLGIQTVGFTQRGDVNPAAFLALYRILRDSACFIVHFNTPRPLLPGGLAARLGGVPVRVVSRRVNFPLRSRLSRSKYNYLLNGIVTVSNSIRQTLIQQGVRPDLVEVIYEGVDLEWLDRQQAPPLFAENQGPVIGTVAQLSLEKGHRTLLEAAAALAPEFPDARFVVVGEGQLRADLESRVVQLGLQDRVVFTGFRKNSEALMKQFDIFCLPSLSEGLSSAILAAMASRLPVVSTLVGGIPELVVDNETGFLVTPRSTGQLSGALRRLLSEEALRSEMGEAGRRRIERRFTLDQKLSHTESFYRRLISRNAIR